MPELPEVETVCRSLRQTVLHTEIKEVQVYLPRLIQQLKIDVFTGLLSGDYFCNVRRRGKYILLDLAGGQTLVVHLRMTGKLLYLPEEALPEKHTHVVITFVDRKTLCYHDVRQFGTLNLVPTDSCLEIPGLCSLGPEPLCDDFTVSWLCKLMQRKKQKVKAFLLDQRNIAGIGNIYADEILFQARIHPEEPVCNLTDEETVTALWTAIRDRLEQGILYGGSSIKDYVDSFGNAGSFQKQHKAYGRSGKPCIECGFTMEKIISAGRSSCYCPNCQIKRK